MSAATGSGSHSSSSAHASSASYDSRLHFETTSYYGGKYSYTEAATVSVPEGGVAAGIDAELEEGGRISGTVVGSSPKVALEGLEVCAREPEHPRDLNNPEKNFGCSTTNAGGEYGIGGLASGAYEVEFNVPYSSPLNFFTQFYDQKSSWPEANLVSVTAGTSISGIDEELPDGGQVSGRVTSASTGAPIEKASVCARGKSTEGYEGRCATTNANGEYTISRLRTANFAVEVSASGYVNAHLGGEWGLTEVEHTVSVTTGSMTAGVDMALEELPRIGGTVTSSTTKAPIAGVEVCVRLMTSTSNSACELTNAQGKYTISDLAVGEYTVEFSPGTLNYLTQYYNDVISPYAPTRISATPGTDATGIDAELEEPGAINGKVTSASTSAALEGIHVCAGEPPEGNRTCSTTNAQGEYMISGLPGRSYYVEFDAGDVNYLTQFYSDESSRAQAQLVSVHAGADTSGIDAQLAPIRGGGLTGTVWSSETGKPIAGIEVCAYEASGEGLFGECAKTESRGEYTITGLAAGEYVVEFSSPSNSGLNYVTQYYNEKASASGAGIVFVGTGSLTPGIDARLREGGRIAGEALDASTRQAIEGIKVCAFSSQSESAGCATTDANGQYTIAGLAHGEYVVEFASPIKGGLDYVTQFYDGKSSAREANTVSVEEGGTQYGVDANLQRGGRVAGRVTDASSKAAIPGVLVCVLTMAGEVEACTFTNPSGEYETSVMPSGEYKVGFDGGKKYVISYYGGTFSFSDAQVVPVAAGATVSGVDAAMLPSDSIVPVNTKPPVVLGSPAIGATLLCADGLWVGSPVPSLTDRWLRDGLAIPGATASSYTVQSADEGHSLACEVTATSSAGQQSAISVTVAIPALFRTVLTTTAPLVSTSTSEAPAKPGSQSAPSPVTIATSTIVMSGGSGGSARVRVQCRVKTCGGSVELTALVLTKLRKGGKTISRKEMLVLAKGSLSLVGKGKSSDVSLRLTAAGERRLAGSTTHPSAAELVVSVRGGRPISKRVVVVFRRGSHRRAKRARAAIVGGSQISIGQAPWQVAVHAVIPEEKGSRSILCGGSILDSAHIITAAHCVFDSKTGKQTPAEDFTVRAGTADLASPAAEEQERLVTDVRPHPYYTYVPNSGRVLPDDIAVLTLQEPFALGAGAAAIPTAPAGSGTVEGTPVNLTGFGEEEPVGEELNGKLYSLAMTVGYSRECGGENDAVVLCASSRSGSPCDGDSGSALTFAGASTTLVGVEDDGILIAGKRCVAGAENAFADVAAPEIQDFIDGSETPPRAPRGGGAVIREAPAGDGSMSCSPGSWSGDPTFTYTFLESTDGQIVQQGASPTYAVPATEVGQAILCEVQASNEGGIGIGRTPGLRAIQAAPIVQSTPVTTPATMSPAPALSATVSLDGTHIATTRRGVATIKLTCTGSGTCQGKLTLTVKTRLANGKKTRARTIATARFWIPAGKTATVRLMLDGSGRTLLSAGRGRLGATMAILKSSPAPAQTASRGVLLVRPPAR